MRRTAVAVVVCISLVAPAVAAQAVTVDMVPIGNTTMPTPIPQTTSAVNVDPVQITVNELLGQWKAAGKGQREAIQNELRDAVTVQFQVRLDGHEKEIEQLEAQVRQLREKLDLRRQKQDEIVDFRVQQLLREAQGLGWGPEPAVRPSGAPSPYGTTTYTPYALPPDVSPTVAPPRTFQPARGGARAAGDREEPAGGRGGRGAEDVPPPEKAAE